MFLELDSLILIQTDTFHLPRIAYLENQFHAVQFTHIFCRRAEGEFNRLSRRFVNAARSDAAFYIDRNLRYDRAVHVDCLCRELKGKRNRVHQIHLHLRIVHIERETVIVRVECLVPAVQDIGAGQFHFLSENKRHADLV